MSTRSRRGLQIAGVVLALVLVLLLVVPLVWPVQPLEDTIPPRQLADSESRFADVGGIEMHYKTWEFPPAGETEGVETAFVLLHGFGASTFSWREVAGPMSQTLPVLAFDRPGFGLTERPLEWNGADPYSPETQADLTVALMDALGVERAVLVGHSAGGTVATLVAARHPERVESLVLEDPAVFAGGAPAFLAPLFRTPQMRRIGPLIARNLGGGAGDDFIRSAWHDPDRIGDEVFEGYRVPLRSENWDQALWLLSIADRPRDVPGILSTVEAPTLFLTGDDDRIVPPEDTERAAGLLEEAELVVIEECGHIPHEERPEEFLDAVERFLSR